MADRAIVHVAFEMGSLVLKCSLDFVQIFFTILVSVSFSTILFAFLSSLSLQFLFHSPFRSLEQECS